MTQINEQGEKIYTDKIKHSSMDDYKNVVFEKNDEYSIFIVRNAGLEYSVKYYNIFDSTLIYDEKDSNLNIVSEESLVEYLTIKDRVQVEYTAEEIQDILKEYKENYKKETDKQKVKEK